MRFRNSSIIPTVDTVVRSSTGSQYPPLVPVDGEDLAGGVDVSDDTARLGDLATNMSSPLDGAPPLKADGGASLEMSASERRTSSTPDLNWLIALGER